jgi:hypothetical protein
MTNILEILDIEKLVMRLREGTFGSDETKTDIVINAYMHNAADALEAQAREIAEKDARIAGLEAENKILRDDEETLFWRLM